MPTFTAIALDTLLGPGASKPVEKSIPRPVPKPLGDGLNRSLDRRNSASLATETKPKRPQLTPSLYTTPEATPLPGSPTSFSPSPYIVNHKRRGPRLLKSSSANCVAPQNNDARAEEEGEKEKADSGRSESSEAKIAEPIEEPRLNGSNGEIENGDGNLRSLRSGWAGSTWSSVRVPSTPERDSDRDDFYDPRESMSFTSSTDVEDNAESERSAQLAAPSVEFYDAWEELSSDSGQQQSSYRDVEADLREMRLSFLMEIEKRKQSEEAFSNMQKQWQNVRRQLSLAGLTLPADPTELEGDGGDTLCLQVHLARFVANAIGRGLVRAELEAEMEKQVEAKNFEIARLCDKLRNYEAMNQEMVQRNQDVLETARRERMWKERRQRWLWGSVAAALSLGAAGLAWTYRPSGTGSLSLTSHDFEAPETKDRAD